MTSSTRSSTGSSTSRRRRRVEGSVTITEVAQAAGVSTATVSRVLAGNYPVAESTRGRVLEVVERLDYAANAHARGLSGAARGPIAVLLGDITGPSFAALASGVERQARARGQLCLVGTTEGDPQRELALIEMLRQQQASAVILPGGAWEGSDYQEQMSRYARSLAAAGGRLVLCGRPQLTDLDSGAICIQYDNVGGAAGVARVQLAAGHRRFLLLPGAEGLSTAVERLEGFHQALREEGIPERNVTVLRSDYQRSSARQAVLDLLAGRPTDEPGFTAVLCGSDVMATGVLEALRQHGLHCPADVSVTGYDDIPGAQDTNPALTTVHVPYEEMGALAVRMALGLDVDADEIAGSDDDHGAGNQFQSVTMPTRVVVRDSVARPRRRRRTV